MFLRLSGRLRACWQRWAVALSLLLALCPGAALAGSRDQLTLLVPDDAVPSSWQVQVWTDAAAEEGLQLKLMSDSAFLALGSAAVQSIGGLVLPDSAHLRASDLLVQAVKQYVAAGGRLLLVYDAGSLNAGGFYDAGGRSRFSDMVGVDYVLDQLLRERVAGFGPVVGTRGDLDNLSLPPGKYLPYPAAAPTIASTATDLVPFVPTNRFDPGGSVFMRQWLRNRAGVPRAASVIDGLRYDRRAPGVTNALGWLQQNAPLSSWPSAVDHVGAVAAPDGAGWTELNATQVAARKAAGDAQLQQISSYGYGAISYYSFVTQGQFPGTVLLSSPEFGLVAGERTYGIGKLMFVNVPLGFFKAIGTDGVLLHGVLNRFATEHVGMPRLAAQPGGVGGLVYNWHVDDGDDVVPIFRALMASPPFSSAGPFSVHFTAGPDVADPGDGLGMDLPNNPAAQDVVLRTAKAGRYAQDASLVRHGVGSHGGWNHNLYGFGANETNEATYLPWLVRNHQAITDVTGERSREYSAPLGNNPSWAVRWLEAYGVVGMYTVSNTGSALTREWRDGARLTGQLWAMPIAPFGTSATFEDFEENGVSDGTSAQWLLDLQSFVVNRRSNRLFYNHPPGAAGHLGVVRTFVQRADQLARVGRFKWYTMTELADFAQRRIQTGWASSPFAGNELFVLANSRSLTDVTMLLPRKHYSQPQIQWGAGTVAMDVDNWVVTARGGSFLRFQTRRN